MYFNSLIFPMSTFISTMTVLLIQSIYCNAFKRILIFIFFLLFLFIIGFSILSDSYQINNDFSLVFSTD